MTLAELRQLARRTLLVTHAAALASKANEQRALMQRDGLSIRECQLLHAMAEESERLSDELVKMLGPVAPQPPTRDGATVIAAIARELTRIRTLLADRPVEAVRFDEAFKSAFHRGAFFVGDGSSLSGDAARASEKLPFSECPLNADDRMLEVLSALLAYQGQGEFVVHHEDGTS